MVVIDIAVLSMSCWITQQCRPSSVVVKQKGNFASLGFQPIFKTFLYGSQHFIPCCSIPHFVCNSSRLDQTVHNLSFIIRISPCCQCIIFDTGYFFRQSRWGKSGTVIIYIRQGGQNAVKFIFDTKTIAIQCFHLATNSCITVFIWRRRIGC